MIRVEHDEKNIRTTMVLLMAQTAAGVIPVPLAVQMAPHHMLNDAWRAAAIAHLNGQTSVKEHEERKKKDAEMFAEMNEEFDFGEKGGSGRIIVT